MRPLFTISALVLVATMFCAPVFAQEDGNSNEARIFSTWDDEFLYIGAKLDVPDVQGDNSKPNSPVDGDDTVTVYLQMDNQGSPAITPECYAMSVSAGGGARFFEGSSDGKLEPKDVFNFKYGKTVQGTLNSSDDIDAGYTVEMALPWSLLESAPPKLGKMVRFNIVVRPHDAEKGDFYSLSPFVKTEEDILKPSTWSRLIFTHFSFGVATTERDKVLSAQYVAAAPLVDGAMADKEWYKNTSVAFGLPVPEGFVYEAKFPPHRTTLAYYFTWFNADTGRAPQMKSINDDGTPAMADLPEHNIGPWFSSMRTDYHRKQLSDMGTAGIDVVLPVYWGDSSNRKLFSKRSLDFMVDAIRSMEHSGEKYPLVGMFLDAGSLDVMYKGEIDMSDEEVQRSVYGMIKDFYDRIPEKYRFYMQSDRPFLGQKAMVVFIYGSDIIDNPSPVFTDYCNRKAIEDFGCPIVWFADNNWPGMESSFDGYFSHGMPAEELVGVDKGRIRTASVSPGYDDTALEIDKNSIVSRMGGVLYDDQWKKAADKAPHFYIVDTWNNYLTGTEVCETRQYGRRYIDATAVNVAKHVSNGDFDSTFVRCEIPRLIKPSSFSQAEVTVRNDGKMVWSSSDLYVLRYRWYKDGRFYGTSKIKLPIHKSLAPGQSFTTQLGIATITEEGSPLPKGEYQLRLEVFRSSDEKWFSELGDQPVMAPVTVGDAPEFDAGFVHVDCPVFVEPGLDYPVIVKVRNDGALTWKKDKVRLGIGLQKVSNYTHGRPDAYEEPVEIRKIEAQMRDDCAPGEIAHFVVDFNLRNFDGSRFTPEEFGWDWSYQLVFDIYDGENWSPVNGIRPERQVVQIVSDDFAAKVVDSSIGNRISAGKKTSVKVVVQNSGVKTWRKNQTKVVCKWYTLDGEEVRCADSTADSAAIAQDVPPGMPVVVETEVTSPSKNGRYMFVCMAARDGEWMANVAPGRIEGFLFKTVSVENGADFYFDLGPYYNCKALSFDTDKAAGDFTADGKSLPWEMSLPDAAIENGMQPVFPAGYNIGLTGQVCDPPVSFLYADKFAGMTTAVRCEGQEIEVPAGEYTKLYIACATSQDTPVETTITLKSATDSSVSQNVVVPSWNSAGGDIAFKTLHRHDGQANTDMAQTECYIHYVVVTLDEAGRIDRIVLPQNKNVKIFAITGERVGETAAASAEEDNQAQ